MAIKAIVFDWDGTLFNSMVYKRQNFIDLFLKYNIPIEKLTQFHIRMSGIPRQELFNKCLKEFTGKEFTQDEYNQISEEYTTLNLSSSKTTSPFPDVKEGLNALKSKGLKLFVSSSSAHDELTEVSKNCGLNVFFEEVLGSQPEFKKGPGHINYICEKYMLEKSEVLFVGDDEQDLMLGKLANVTAIKIDRKKILPQQITKILEIVRFI